MAKKEKSFGDTIRDIVGDSAIIEDLEREVKAIPTGSLALDVSIGAGGIPKGRFTEIFGVESAGKTTLALSIIKNGFESGTIDSFLYVDTENNLNLGYVKSLLGEYIGRGLIVQPLSAEDAFSVSLKGVEEGIDLIIFDSVGSLSPSKELEDDFTQQHVGLVPRLMSKFLRMAGGKVRENNTAFVFINQVRDNIGTYYGGLTTPAGHALRHFLSLRIQLSKGKDIEDKETVIGNLVNFTIKKNKVGVPFRTAFTNNIYGTGIDYYRDVINFGTLLGVVESRASYFAFEGTTIGSKPGLLNTAISLSENRELLDKIVRECYNTAKVKLPEYLHE